MNNDLTQKGKIILISGPSGVGKRTILDAIMKDESLNLVYSISYTTRPQRQNEVNGVDYNFVSKNQFEQAIMKNAFLEYAQFCGNYYGTPKQGVLDLINQGKNVLLEIEVQGAENILKMFQKDEIVSIFIAPPSLEELKARLLNRNTETLDVINNRIKQAEYELELQKLYNFIVVNHDLTKAQNEIKAIISKNGRTKTK